MSVIDGLTSAAKILREADKIEQYQLILDAQKELLDNQRRIGELEEEVRKLKDISEFKKNSTFQNNCYWLSTDGPFCSKYLDSDNIIVRLYVRHIDGYATCPDCKNNIFSVK